MVLESLSLEQISVEAFSEMLHDPTPYTSAPPSPPCAPSPVPDRKPSP